MIKYLCNYKPFLFAILFLLVGILALTTVDCVHPMMTNLFTALSNMGSMCVLCYILDIKNFFDVKINRYICKIKGHIFTDRCYMIKVKDNEIKGEYVICTRCMFLKSLDGNIFTH